MNIKKRSIKSNICLRKILFFTWSSFKLFNLFIYCFIFRLSITSSSCKYRELEKTIFKKTMDKHDAAAAAAKSLQLCLTLCYPIDSSSPGSSVSGILQARILEWVAISFSNACMHAKLCLTRCLTLCLTLCDRIDSSPPGSSVHGIL